MRKLAVILPVVVLFPAASPAEEAPSTSANLALTSNYVSRGFTQSWGRPALQGGIDHIRPSGLFAGLWFSTLSTKEFRDGPLEVDLYGGMTGSMAGLNWTAAAYYYLYPGSSSPFVGNRRYDYAEAKLGLSQGAWSINGYWVLTQRWFGTFSDARGSSYLELGYTADLGEGWTLPVQAGFGQIRKHPEARWRQARFGLNKSLDGGLNLLLTVSRAWDRDQFYTSANYSIDPQGLVPVKRLGPTQWALTLSKSW
ncbi:TorF family putative porin [Kinneretia asaccharophila]|uniref:Uncharacterized protein (TIGR02001 family) n=1 Tax=Roseateles asaccharophilus TaxID=582607 RepID=A0A4R6MZT6_9BURK|nr:TorF family putative porin [Roseateles asaccharophilus]MDN3544280.1 TorF family putative porin [Roseateles asaccharophilus]TDP06361.1 uncharacterized protein (TIGR02001 family) [Roseateles asaccharophilus]